MASIIESNSFSNLEFDSTFPKGQFISPALLASIGYHSVEPVVQCFPSQLLAVIDFRLTDEHPQGLFVAVLAFPVRGDVGQIELDALCDSFVQFFVEKDHMFLPLICGAVFLARTISLVDELFGAETLVSIRAVSEV